MQTNIETDRRDWTVSRFRAGDLVQVRSKEEILSTLDSRGCIDGMPFMPEMFQFCDEVFRVEAVAHKTCETALRTYVSRQLNSTVHLSALRCDGSAHGGCEADCNLYWRDEWLRPADERTYPTHVSTVGADSSRGGCTEAELFSATRVQTEPASEPIFSCQATQVFEASGPLPWWNARQYFLDVSTQNRSARAVLSSLFLASIRRLHPKVPFGYRVFGRFSSGTHRFLTGRGVPVSNGRIPEGVRTPTLRLGLQPGDYVRIRDQDEIEETIDKQSKNRGLYFDSEEMAPYCGRTARVRRVVTSIVEEHTGRMIRMKEPCIILEGVVCQALYARCRLNCPRAIPCFWREIWLERISASESVEARGSGA